MPHFLGVQAVLAIHDDQIRLYGGAYGVRDWNALESTVRQPAATFGGTYLYGDVFAMASALGHGLMTSHPFLDGNKRTGGMAMLTFLAINGVTAEIPEAAYYAMVMATATGTLTREQLAESLRRWGQ
jgi:death-on-curing protein